MAQRPFITTLSMLIGFVALSASAGCPEAADPKTTVIYKKYEKVTQANINLVAEPAVSSKGNWIAVGEEDKSVVTLAQIKDSKVISSRQVTHSREVAGSRFSYNEEVLVTIAPQGKHLWFWKTANGTPIRDLDVSSYSNWEISPDGRNLFLQQWSSRYRRVDIIELETGERSSFSLGSVQPSKTFKSGMPFFLTFGPGGKVLIVTNQFQLPEVFEKRNGAWIKVGDATDPGHESLAVLSRTVDLDWSIVEYQGAASSPDSKNLVLWGAQNIATKVIKNPDDTTRVESGGLRYVVEVWDVNTMTFKGLVGRNAMKFPIGEGHLSKAALDELREHALEMGSFDHESSPGRMALAAIMSWNASNDFNNPFGLGTMGTIGGREVIALGTLSLSGNDSIVVLDVETGHILDDFKRQGGHMALGIGHDRVFSASRGDKAIQSRLIEVPHIK